jgi:hypothetical protein
MFRAESDRDRHSRKRSCADETVSTSLSSDCSYGVYQGRHRVAVKHSKGRTVESAVAISAPSLLDLAALSSAKQSQFKCLDCTEELTQYHLFYSFRIDAQPSPCTGPNSCNTPTPVEHPPEVAQLENHITLTGHPSPVCICDYLRKVRSVKCLYLWKCGHAW